MEPLKSWGEILQPLFSRQRGALAAKKKLKKEIKKDTQTHIPQNVAAHELQY